MPDRPEILQITTEDRSLLATWTYSNPPLTEGAVISGYRVYINSSNYRLNRTAPDTQLTVTGLTPFTNYTVEVSAFNTRGDGSVQEGPRSDPTIAVTLGILMFVADPPMVPRGQRVTLRCTITAQPTVNFSEIVRIMDGDEVVVANQTNDAGDREFMVVYVFENPAFPDDDRAMFQCRAMNDNGLAVENVTIIIQGELYIDIE